MRIATKAGGGEEMVRGPGEPGEESSAEGGGARGSVGAWARGSFLFVIARSIDVFEGDAAISGSYGSCKRGKS